MIKFRHSGSFKNTEKFFAGAKGLRIIDILNKFGNEGVKELSMATPVDSGLTANSWSYRIVSNRQKYGIVWTNSNMSDGLSIAVLLQYGHGTGNGGYVAGRDYINPVINPIVDRIAETLWKEVSSL